MYVIRDQGDRVQKMAVSSNLMGLESFSQEELLKTRCEKLVETSTIYRNKGLIIFHKFTEMYVFHFTSNGGKHMN